jgi:N6-adenosine-specific RNA methylase IME4
MNELQLRLGPYRTTFVGTEILRASTSEEWQNYGEILRRVDEAKQWAIGDWLVDGKRHYGDGLYEKAEKILAIQKGTLWNLKSIATLFEFSLRNENLSWYHHNTIASLKKIDRTTPGKWKLSNESDTEKMQEFLEKAEKENLSVRALRELVSAHKNRQQEEIRLANEPEKYSVIYLDPPWQYDNTGFEMSASKQYNTMSIAELEDYPVRQLSAEDCVIFMWATNPLLKEAIELMGTYGFQYKTNFVWEKDNHTAGFYVYGQHELLLIGTRGSKLPAGEKFKSIIHGKNLKHSQKPEIVYEIIERMYPGNKYIELFARNTREGWDSYGDQV